MTRGFSTLSSPLMALVFLLLAILMPLPALAAVSPIEMQTEDEQLVRWDLSADSVVTFNDSEVMEATGNVYLRRGQEYLKADFARYYMSTKWVYLKGNVQVRTGRDEVTAEEAEFDLRSRTGWLKKGRIFMDGPHTYISGNHINKHWGDVYTFKEATITTCDGDSPAWSLSAEEAVVEIDGYARLTRSTMEIKNQPVGYTPYFIFPVKTKRQTGFLLPDYGRSTTKGLFYTQPFFWAIDDSNDMTVTETWMEKRGFSHGVEFRTKPSVDTTGWIRADWMYDKTRVLEDNKGYGKDDGYVRTNRERYWIRGMYDAVLPDPAWRFKADLDYVSDQDYLSEFDRDITGFERSRDETYDLFSREFREKNRDRVSGLLLTRDWQRGSVALGAQYTQNPALGHGNTPHNEDTNVQKLPQFDAFLYKGRIFPAFPLEIEGNFQAAYFHRRESTRGARYQVAPKLVLPFNTRYGSIIASVGVTQTLYDTENPTAVTRESNGRKVRTQQDDDWRTVPEFSIAASTEFSRAFTFDTKPLPLTNATVGESQWIALRHSIQPRVEYRQRPHEDQDNYPFYESDDRLGPQTEIVYSLTNIITTKTETVGMAKNDDGEVVPTLFTSYRDLVRLRLEQAFDQREATRDDHRDRYPRRSFGDALGELYFYPWSNLSLSTRNHYSPYENALTRHESGVNLDFPGYGNIYAGYDMREKIEEYTRQQNDNISYVQLSGGINYFQPFTLSAAYRHDLKNTDNTETEFRLTYNHQCFQIIGTTIVEPEEERYQISIVLTGLGD